MEIVRKSISFPKELADKIGERARLGNRSFSAQVVYEISLITKIVSTEQISIGFREDRVETKE